MFQNIDNVVNQYAYEDLSYSYIFDHIKALRQKGDVSDIVTSVKKYLTYDYSLIDIAYLALKQINKSRQSSATITGFNDTIIIHDHNSSFMMSVMAIGSNVCATDKLKADFEVGFVGTRDQITKMIEFFDETFRSSAAKISWYFVSRDGVDSVGLYLPDVLPIFPEYYPWLEEGPTEYFRGYLKSTSPILFLSGDPGSGKTSYIRAMINEFNLNTFVGYDQKLFTSDTMFIEFLTSPIADILVLEDSESLVYPRKSENNTLISRLLNVSDGLLKLPRKKIVFTTNDAGFTNVDDALLRPGRCYDSKEFRPLTFEEAKKAAKKANVTEPKKDQDYTLAALFHQQQKVRKTKVGF